MIAASSGGAAASSPDRGRTTRLARLRTTVLGVLGLVWVVLGPSAFASAAAPATAAATSRRSETAGPGRWQRELDRRRAILAARRGSDPGAIVALLGILPELSGEIDPDELFELIDEVARDPRRHPLVSAHAHDLASRMMEARGDVRGAQARLEAQGFLLGWQIVGPFDNTKRAGETRAFAPETEPYTPDQEMFGKLSGEPLQWRVRDYEDIPRGAYVSFDDLLRPREEVTAYATCWVKVPEATDAALHIGTGGPYAVWVEDREIGRGSAYRAAHPLQETHPLRLRAGWNRLLVKVSALEGMWGFQARLSAPSGAPLAGLQTSAEMPEGWTAGIVPAPLHPSRVVSLRTELERRYPLDGKRRGTKTAGTDLVAFYRYVHPFDRDDETATRVARAVDEHVRTSRSAYMLALLDRDPSTALVALRRGIERARKEGSESQPLLAEMLLELAWRQRMLGLDARYRELVDEAHRVAPDDPVVELALVERKAEAGYQWWATHELQALVRRHPASETLQAELASRLRALGRPEEALAILEDLARRRGGTASVLGQRIDILLDLGRPDDAVALATRAVEAAPGLPEVHATLARLQEASGDTQAAAASLARAVALAPQDHELHNELGRLLARTGATEAAITALQRSLQLHPQQPHVRDLLATLDAGAGRDLFTRYAVDLTKIGKLPTPTSWKGKSAGVLHHRVAVKVLPNGLTERLDHRIVRIVDDRGVRSQAVQAMSFDPAESTVEVRRARVRRKDGTIEEIGEPQMVALASAGYRMYYDQRQIRVVFSGLRVGDTLEVAFLRRDIAARNMFDEYFGDVVPLRGTEPMRHVEYILEAPADKPIYFNLPVKKRLVHGGKTALYRHVEKDVPGIQPEPGMPGWTEVARYLHASTYRTWNEVGTWYWNLVREQLVVDEEIRKAVKEAIAGLPPDADEAAKVRAIYAYVVRNTRYVGLEFGIHGYKPYRTTEVISRRFGDCKDKASLLKVMLKEVGIDSNLVLVRTSDQGNVPAEPASLAVFNHAITYVPSLELYLDGTAEWSGPDELPAGDQGASVLIIKDGKGADFRTIPVTDASHNTRHTTQRVRLQPAGSATVEHAVNIRGTSAAALRFGYHAEEQRRERIAKAFADVFPGVEVESVEAPDIDDIQRPVDLRARLRVPTWATREGDRLRFRVLGRDSELAATWAGKDRRIHALVMDVPSTETHRITYELPAGFRFTQVPAPKRIDTPMGRFVLEVERTDRGATVSSTLELRKRRIEADQYPAFREFLRQVDATLEQTFEVAPER